MMDLNYPLAFGAGILSFLSPCVLPLIPVYLGTIGALGFPGDESGRQWSRKEKAMPVALAFILGFSTVFIMLGLSAGTLDLLLLEYRESLYRLGGVVVILFGLKQLGLFKLPFLERGWNLRLKTPLSSGVGGAFLMGTIFSLGWSPCVGPILGSILLLAMGTGDPSIAAVYLFMYSAGLAVPFLLLALFLEKISARWSGINSYLPLITKISGVLLLLFGILLVSGLFQRLLIS